MRILYITEDFAGTKVHHNLVSNIQKQGVDVTVFAVLRGRLRKFDFENEYGEIGYHLRTYKIPDSIQRRYKLDFNFKTKIKYKALIEQCGDISRFDLVHASTLFSDGAIALKIFKEFGVPYISAIRGTDIDLYMRKMVHLWVTGHKIIKNSQSLPIMTPMAFKNCLKCISTLGIRREIKSKSIVVPNGIDNIWIENSNFVRKRNGNDTFKYIYVGRFDTNKNAENLIKAIINIHSKGYKVSLTLIGASGPCEQHIIKLCSAYPECLSFKGHIKDRLQLLKILREHHAFAMVSHSETFGLSYIEALSQGLPILYSKNTGIDGFFESKIGEGVQPKSISEIEHGLIKIIQNYKNYNFISKELPSLNWKSVSVDYFKIYKRLVTERK